MIGNKDLHCDQFHEGPPPIQIYGTPALPMSPQHSHSSSFVVLTISILGILSTSILLLCYYIFVIKCCWNSRSSDYAFRRRFSRSQRRRDLPFLTMSYFTAPENRGLDASSIRAIPTVQYRRSGSQNHECAVCLTEFDEQETIKLLPNCNHVFHIDCIDTWLQTNANCPLCRSLITATTTTTADPVDVASRDDQNACPSDDHVIEVKDNGGCDESPSISANHLPKKVSSMGDECIDVRSGNDEHFCVQPMRRSFSMDSSTGNKYCMAVQKMMRQQSQEFDESGSSSSSGSKVRRSFFSFGRSSRNAVKDPAMQSEA